MFKKIFNKIDGSSLDLNFKLVSALFIIVLSGIVVSMVTFSMVNANLKVKIADSKEADRPAKLTITVINDKNCIDCFDVDLLLETIIKENVEVVSMNEIDYSSIEGKELINQHAIKSIPSLVVSGELAKNYTVQSFLSQIGEIQEDIFVMRNQFPPYLDLATNTVKGRVKLTMIMDRSCDSCYDVTKHEEILRNFGFSSFESEVVEVGFGNAQELIDNYSIDLLPTIILTGEIEYYPNLNKIWEQVGTIESDGTYVFRDGVKQMGIYQDLVSGQVVIPQANKIQ